MRQVLRHMVAAYTVHIHVEVRAGSIVAREGVCGLEDKPIHVVAQRLAGNGRRMYRAIVSTTRDCLAAIGCGGTRRHRRIGDEQTKKR